MEKNTVSQNDSIVWHQERKKRITASHFGRICSKLPYTSCRSIVKSMLYSHFDNEYLRYGREHEKDAIEYLIQSGIIVEPCGLFVDKYDNYLGASPDGLIGKDGLVEVKCPASCKDLTPDECIITKKFNFWLISKDGKTTVNKKHKYFFQIQGQLHVTERKYCIFVLWTPKGVKTEKIVKDDNFWEINMRHKLKNFYFDCLLPEIVDARFPRSMDIRDPYSIIEAQEKRNASKKK